MTPLIGIAEAARLLAVSKITVRRLVHGGELPCVRFNAKNGAKNSAYAPMKFDLRDIEKFVEQRKA